MVAGRMQRPEYGGWTDTKESPGRCVRHTSWKINLRSPCRVTCNFKDVKSVKRRRAPPQEIKVYIHTTQTLAKRISARAPRVARGGSLALAHFGRGYFWFSRYLRAWRASGASIFINPRMNVCIFIRRLDRLRRRGCVAYKMPWERGKRKLRRTKFRRSITWECYIMYQIYVSMHRFARVESALA